MFFWSDIASAAFNGSCVCKVAERSIFDDTTEGSENAYSELYAVCKGEGFYFLLTALAL